jgi:D-amino-acid dehydrogenase
VFYNTGHGHLGWTLSAITADMVGDVVFDTLCQDRNTFVEAVTRITQ